MLEYVTDKRQLMLLRMGKAIVYNDICERGFAKNSELKYILYLRNCQNWKIILTVLCYFYCWVYTVKECL